MKFRVICYVEQDDLAAIVQVIAPLGEVTIEPPEFIAVKPPRKPRRALGTTLKEVTARDDANS